MNQENPHQSEQIQKLMFDTNFSIDIFRQKIHQYNQSINHKQSIIYAMIETLIIEQKFYDYFSSSFAKSLAYSKSNFDEKDILSYGYSIIQELFATNWHFQNDNLILSALLKKCSFDVFILIAMCKGYLSNPLIRREKIKTFFIQNFKKNNHHFAGIQRFTDFHQSIVEKSSIANTFIYNQTKALKSRFQLNYFLNFYLTNRDFFPSTLQCDNLIFKMMTSLKLETEEDIRLYEKFQQEYFTQNQYHLVTTCKNIRFLIQFFRNPFNEKFCEFYPQKVFLKMLTKYNKEEINKIISCSEVGLTWNQDQISSTIGSIFKLGLTSITFNFFQALLSLWLRNGLVDSILKLSEVYIAKIFIFIKHQRLFDISLAFLQQFILGPKVPTIGILNKLLEKLFPFVQKDCPSSKKKVIEQFMCLIESKYEKVATLEDKNYIQLKNMLKNIRQNQKREILPQQQVKRKLKQFQWQETKISLFSNTASAQGRLPLQKEPGQYRGLYNIGNSCYMNSFLQCLFMTIEFRYNILSLSTLALEQNILQKLHQQETQKEKVSQKIIEKNPSQHNKSLVARQSVRPTAELQRLFAQMLKSKRPSISPINIKNVSSPEFKNTFQQDTIQFGRSFLDIISRSSVQNIFEGQQTNEIICPNCQKSRFKKENFIDIMLTDYQEQEKGKQSDSQGASNDSSQGFKISKMLKKSFQPQKIEGLTCDFCETRSAESLKRQYLSKHPNYLILTMKRFCYDIKENKNVKKHYRVDLSENMINVEGQMYELYSIIVHRGLSANSGHYFAFCKQWNIVEESSQMIEEQKEKNIQHKDNLDNKQEKVQSNMPQKMEIENEGTIQIEKLPQSNLNQITSTIHKKSEKNRWLCLNDCIVSVFESFNNVKQFLDLNQQDTPYILFYQKISHVRSPKCKHLTKPIKLREPLEKFLQKDNNQYAKFLQNKSKLNLSGKQTDWKNFGKVKGFTAYDFFKFTKQDDEERDNGFGGGGFGNTPIL